MTRQSVPEPAASRILPALIVSVLLPAVLAILPVPSRAADAAPVAPPAGNAATAAALAKRYDPAPCAACHREIFDQWRASGHAASMFGGGRTAAGFRRAVRDGLMAWPWSGVKGPGDVKGGHLSGCARCHLPQLSEATDEAAREIVASLDAWQEAKEKGDAGRAAAEAEKLSSLNVGCLVCHNRNALVHKYVDGTPDPSAVYGSKEGSHPAPYTALRRTPILRESILCGQCHGTGPSFEHENPSQCATAYGSWLFGYRSEGGVEECQGCHMGKGSGHSMKGRVPGGGEAVTVSYEARGYLWRDGDKYVPRVAVNVRLANRAGHALPDGPLPERHFLLEVTATDEAGTEIFRKARTFGPEPRRIGTAGDAAAGPHDATGLLSDDSIPSGESARERFDLFFPPLGPEGKAPGKVAVRVRLFRAGDFAGGGAGKAAFDERREVAFEAKR